LKKLRDAMLREGHIRLKEQWLKKLGIIIECKSFTFNGKMGSVPLSKKL